MRRLGRNFRLRSIVSAVRSTIFSPSSLFAAGEQGVWYDPSDFTTLFQDSAGTTPVTAVEQPVGKMLDKSGRGNHATQATSANRPVVSARVNLLLATETLSTQNVTTLAKTYTLKFSGVGTITTSGTNVGVYTAGTYTITCTAGTLTLTVAGIATQADLRLANDGVGLPAYQRVTTSTDYDTVGFPKYLKCDGVDDGMVTGSINFTTTDKMTVFSGIRRFIDVDGVILELSANWNTNVGSFLHWTGAAVSGTGNGFNSASRGSAGATVTLFCYTPAVFIPPVSAVFTSLHDIQGDLSVARGNGVSGTNGIGDKGTGNFGNYPLYLFRRGGTTIPFNGRCYSLIVRGAQSTTEQITNTETYVNNLTKAY